jgi:hypothetical protein
MQFWRRLHHEAIRKIASFIDWRFRSKDVLYALGSNQLFLMVRTVGRVQCFDGRTPQQVLRITL